MEKDEISSDFVVIKHNHLYDQHDQDMSIYGFDKLDLKSSHKHLKKITSKSTSVFRNNIEQSNDKFVEDRSTELTQLRPRNPVAGTQSYSSIHSKLATDNIVLLEREILPTDTLQSFALQYNCTINDLKRANNLIKEQDFFALRQIKIPVKRYGLLTELDEEIKRRPLASATLVESCFNHNQLESTPTFTENKEGNKHQSSFINESDESSQLLNDRPSPRRNSAIENNDTGKFLKSVDKEIRSTVKKAENQIDKNEILEEVVSSLGSVEFQSVPLPGAKSSAECDGSSWGLTWQMVMVSFVFGMIFVAGFIIIKDFIGL